MLELAAIALSSLSATALEEVVVTARRREERLADVAASITRLTPGDPERLDLTHHAESLNRVVTPSASILLTTPRA